MTEGTQLSLSTSILDTEILYPHHHAAKTIPIREPATNRSCSTYPTRVSAHVEAVLAIRPPKYPSQNLAWPKSARDLLRPGTQQHIENIHKYLN